MNKERLRHLLYFAITIPSIISIWEMNPIHTKLERKIASDSNCTELISSFYNKQELDLIESRIEAVKHDPHKFYRSFPPLYFKIVEDLKINNLIKNLYKHKGVIGGDVHVENFGVRKFKDEYRLLINDFDDLSTGPLILDPIRHLTSIQLSGLDINKKFIRKYFKRYLEGLNAAKENYADVTLDFFKEAKKSNRISKKKINLKKMIFLEKRTPNFDLSEKELNHWTKVMKPYGKIVDHYKYIKATGGSGGLDRYELLIEKDGELFWLEVKEWDTPGINAGLGTKAPSYSDRIKYVQKYDQPEIISNKADFNGKTFFIREINDSHIGVAIDDLKAKEMKDMYLDEAYALGFFHHTLETPQQYKAEIENIDDEAIYDIVDQIYQKFLNFTEK